MAICSAIFWRLRLRRGGLARVDFGARGGDELVDEVVGLDAEALAAADFDVGRALSSSETSVAKLLRAARRERDHLVAEVGVVIGLLGVAHAAQGLDDVGLRVGLARSMTL
jgi:DNA-binding phage protein